MRNHAPWSRVLAHAFHEFHEHDLFTSAAAMSYFGLLTLFPMLLVLLTISNSIAAGSELLQRVVDVYPGSGDFLERTVRSLNDVGTGVIVSCVFIMLWAGSWVFAVCERALNRVWGTKPRRFLHGRTLTLGLMGSIGLLLSLSVFLTSALVWLKELAARLPIRVVRGTAFLAFVGDAFWQSVFALVSLLVTIALFTIIYRLVPNGRVVLRDTLPGAVLAGLLWEAAKYIFASSLKYFHYDQVYGSVGAVVAVLTWGYVSSLILLFGAQLSATLHNEHPTEIAAATAFASGNSPIENANHIASAKAK